MMLDAEVESDGHEAWPLYLPLSSTLSAKLASGLPPVVEALSVAELAAILLVQAVVLRGFSTASVAESWLAAEIEIGCKTPACDGNSLAQKVRRHYDPLVFSAGLDRLESLNIQLLDDTEVAQAAYLLPDGLWDSRYCHRRFRDRPSYRRVVTPWGSQLRLSDAQSRMFNELRTALDEPAEIQGYAGTGKSFLINAFLTLLEPYKTLLLALTSAQVGELQKRIKATGVEVKTFAALARDICESDLTIPSSLRRRDARSRLNYRVSHDEVAALLALAPVGDLSAAQVANICNRTVMSFCWSDDMVLDIGHLPRQCANLPPVDKSVLVEYASRFWEETLEPKRIGKPLPLRSYHRIKYLTLMGRGVPPRYSHVIVDESHDLPRSLIALLHASPQTILTLGDEYQQLQGRAQPHSQKIRRRLMAQSVRGGRQMEEILNPLLLAHPNKAETPFVGARERQTRIIYYDRSAPPEHPTMIVVRSEWGLFEWFLRLSHEKARFGMSLNNCKALDDFVQGCCELRKHGNAAKHGALFRYKSWEALASAMSYSATFEMIERRLERGYSYKPDFVAAAKSLDSTAPIQLSLLTEVRNREFDSVMLGTDFLMSFRRDDYNESAQAFAAIYTAASRARYELIVPSKLGGWVEDKAFLSESTNLRLRRAPS